VQQSHIEHAWIEAGKPNVGVIADDRKKDKYSYRHKIRQGQAKEKSNISNSLHDALINKNQGGFWKIWKSKFGTKKCQPHTINGKNRKIDIANEFADYFSEACSCNSDTRNLELLNEFNEMKKYCCVSYSKSDYYLSVEIVGNMIQQLHVGKAAGIDGLTVEHIHYCHPIIVLLLTKLFNAIQHYDYVPHGFGVGLTVPIPEVVGYKHAGSTADYRCITVSSVLSNIFEHCLMKKYEKYLYSESCQFGFKKKTGINHAIYTVRKNC